MKGIYLTEEAKAEIEAKIAELEIIRNESSSDNNDYYLGRIKELEEILSSATILPVEESWEAFDKATNAMYKHFKSTGVEYPNGVIIQPKQEKL
jgi:transcription elongation GreA/GreB family factor